MQEVQEGLGRIHAETEVLNHSSCSEGRCANLEEVSANIERTKGVEGYTNTQSTPEVIHRQQRHLTDQRQDTRGNFKNCDRHKCCSGERKKRLEPLIKT